MTQTKLCFNFLREVPQPRVHCTICSHIILCRYQGPPSVSHTHFYSILVCFSPSYIA